MTEETVKTGEAEKEQKPKKRKGRRAYLEDIRRAPNGGYIYTGKCYRYDETCNLRREVLVRLWLLTLPMLIAAVAGGCLSAPFTRDTWYVLAPLAFELVSVGSVVWAVGRITGNGEILREYTRKQTFGAIPLRCGFAIGFAAAGLVGAAIYLIMHGTAVVTPQGTENRLWESIVYLVLKAVSILFGVLLSRYSRSVIWKESDKIV